MVLTILSAILILASWSLEISIVTHEITIPGYWYLSTALYTSFRWVAKVLFNNHDTEVGEKLLLSSLTHTLLNYRTTQQRHFVLFLIYFKNLVIAFFSFTPSQLQVILPRDLSLFPRTWPEVIPTTWASLARTLFHLQAFFTCYPHQTSKPRFSILLSFSSKYISAFIIKSIFWKSIRDHPYSFFFLIYFISWRLITLQYCSGFCHTLTWISHGFTCIPYLDPPSHLPLYPIPLGLTLILFYYICP